MAKQKKITIKHFLNKRVRPRNVFAPSGYAPVYTSITYNQKTTTLNLFYETNAQGMREKEFNAAFIERGNYIFRRKIETIEEALRLCIRYQIAKRGGDFDLTDISSLFKYFLLPISGAYNAAINEHFSMELEDWITITGYKEVYGLAYSDNYMYPRNKNFAAVYARIKQWHVRDIAKKIRHTMAYSIISGYVQYMHFENAKSEIIVSKNTLIPKQYLMIDWLAGSVKEDFKEFVIDKTKGNEIPAFRKTIGMLDEDEQAMLGLLEDFEARDSALRDYIDLIDKVVKETIYKGREKR